MSELRLTIPLVPPGFNHYVKHTRAGRHYVTSEARNFKEALATHIYMLPSWTISAKTFEVEIWVYLGFGQKGDVDGFPKLVLDGLAKCGVFRNLKGKAISDAHITDLILRKRRDRERPRTEIRISGR